VFLEFLDKFHERVPYTIARKMPIWIYVRQNLLFEVQLPISLDPNNSNFCLWGPSNTTVYSDLIKNEQIFHRDVFSVCQTVRNLLGAPQRVRQSTVRRVHWAIIQVEDILSIFVNCEFIKKNFQNSLNWNVYCKCIVSVVSEILRR